MENKCLSLDKAVCFQGLGPDPNSGGLKWTD